MLVLVLNPGSSTLKASVVDTGVDPGAPSNADATVEWPAGSGGAGAVVGHALAAVGAGVDAVGYRVVHGGDAYRAATPVNDRLIATVEELDALAPLHNRRAAAVIRAGRALLPELPHIACFDTAFHATLPEAAYRYPIPAAWVEAHGIRRFGFHGLSVAWAVRRTGELLERPPSELGLVVAHLGSGSSVTAVQDGRSADTSMGLTPFEGLMMGTRAGSIDPGILLHLLDRGVTPDELADGLAHGSGLAAVAGSSDVRELLDRADAGDGRATLALEMFARRAAAGIAAVAVNLDHLDALVFTGGIGSSAAPVRQAIVGRLRALGLPGALADASPDAVLHPGPPAVVTVLAREDAVIAEEAARLLGASTA